MGYYIAENNTPKGPYSIRQLRSLGITKDDLVWCKGMDAWVKAGEVEELVTELFMPPVPPKFDKERYESTYGHDARTVYGMEDKCPSSYMWLAILSLLFIWPFGIVAIIKASSVNKLWMTGRRDEARSRSRSAFRWALISLIIGIPLSIYYINNVNLYGM